MATLRPHYYTSESKEYTTGWPTSNQSAMYTTYSNWAMMPIFKNPENYPIKIKSVSIKFGINSGSAKAKLYFANLDTAIKDESDFYECSNEFDVPVTTALKSITKDLDTNVVIDSNRYFAIGFKSVKTSGRGRLSVARTNTLNKTKDRTFYNGQNLDKNFGKISIDRIPKSDYWSFQVPVITVEYEINKITPILSSSSVIITQGESAAVNISGYDDWSVGHIDEILTSNGVIIDRNNSTINILSLAANFDKAITGNITIDGLNSSANINVTINPPNIASIYVSMTSIRPMESSTFNCDTPGAIFTPIYKDFNATVEGDSGEVTEKYCVTCENSTFTANALNEDTIYDINNEYKENYGEGLKHPWTDSVFESAIGGYFTHPLNNCVKTEEKYISLGHYDRSYINVDLSATESYYKTDVISPTVRYYDNTSVYGGVNVYVDEEYNDSNDYFTVDNENQIVQVNAKTFGIGVTLIARLVNDSVVFTSIGELYTIETVKFSYNGLNALTDDNDIDAENEPWVGIGLVYKNDNVDVLKINPFCYPIKITFPSMLFEDEDHKITINNLSVGFNQVHGFSVDTKLCENYADCINKNINGDIDVKNLVTDAIEPGQTYFISLDNLEINSELEYIIEPERPEINHIEYYENEIEYIVGYVKFSLNYCTKDSEGTITSCTRNFVKKIKIIINSIIPLYKNYFYSEGSNSNSNNRNDYIQTNVVGSKMSIDSEPVKSINSLAKIVNSLNINYKLLNSDSNADIKIDKIISASSNESISNEQDKLAVETYLNRLNSFISAINRDSKVRHIPISREKIAIGQPIMWDDSLALFENKATKTASPWKELYNTISNLNFSGDYYIWYDKDNNKTITDNSEYISYVDKTGEEHTEYRISISL